MRLRIVARPLALFVAATALYVGPVAWPGPAGHPASSAVASNGEPPCNAAHDGDEWYLDTRGTWLRCGRNPATGAWGWMPIK